MKDVNECTWDLCNRNEFNKNSKHCNTKWCSEAENKDKFGCKTATLTIKANSW